VVVLSLGCRCCRLSVNIICGRIMIGLSLLSSVSKHNVSSYYEHKKVSDFCKMKFVHVHFAAD
jgi:hypothetical protein